MARARESIDDNGRTINCAESAADMDRHTQAEIPGFSDLCDLTFTRALLSACTENSSLIW